MTTIVTLRLPKALLKDAAQHAETLHLSHTEYMRQALDHYNQLNKNKLTQEHLNASTAKIRAKEFE